MSDALLWNEIGKIFLRLGSPEEAIVAYTRAIELNPDSGGSYCNLGHAYFLKGEFGQALFFFRKSIQLMDAPRNQAVVWNNIGDSYRALKDIDNAILAYKKADDLDMGASPSEQNASRRSGSIANIYEPVKTEKAVPSINSLPTVPQKTVTTGESSLMIQALEDGFLPIDAGKGDEEDRFPPDRPGINPPVSPDPNRITDQDITASMTADHQNPTFLAGGTENTSFRDGKSRDPSSIHSGIDNLEEILAKVNIYENITRANSTNDRAWDTLGKLYKSLGRYQDAIGAYQKAIEMAPDREVYYYYLGLLYSVEQQHDDAVRAFQVVLNKNPDYILAHSALAGVYHRMGLENKANQHIATALPKMNNESTYNRACFYAICGDTELAFEFLRLALINKDTTIEWIKSDPDLDPIRTDQRYQELISEKVQPVQENKNENYFSSELEGTHNRLLPILNHSLAR